MVYYASGFLDIPGAMITASHNPARYNGIKLCKAGAKPVGIETGLAEIKADGRERRARLRRRAGHDHRAGTCFPGYAEYLKKLVDISGIRPLKVVVDAGNGMGGYTVPTVFEGLPITTIPLYFELDGTFPNHEANPIDPENLRDLQRRSGSTRPTSASPSTATPTGASSSTSAARSSARRCSPR